MTVLQGVLWALAGCLLVGCGGVTQSASSSAPHTEFARPVTAARPIAVAPVSASRPPDAAHEHGPVGAEPAVAIAPEPALTDVPPPPAESAVVYPFHAPLAAPPGAAAPATRNANLSPAACRALVQKKKLPVKRDGRPTPGVATALRFTGPVHGITFLTAGWKSPFGVMDCRLVLALDELAEVLTRHDVTQVHVGTIYRKNSKLGKNKLSQHAHGLAADIVAFKLADGRLLEVERDFGGELGAPVCGPDSRVAADTPEAIALRNLVCDVARSGLFHYMLTPNHDQAHHDHLHVDIKRNAKRTVIR
ncbi:MAG TPA: extensin family protein [Polyangiaceae bacterium]